MKDLENRLQIENFAESDSVNKQLENFYEIFYAIINKFASNKNPPKQKATIL